MAKKKTARHAAVGHQEVTDDAINQLIAMRGWSPAQAAACVAELAELDPGAIAKVAAAKKPAQLAKALEPWQKKQATAVTARLAAKLRKLRGAN